MTNEWDSVSVFGFSFTTLHYSLVLEFSMQDAVTVVGYPIGGESISVTSGVVSRIEARTVSTRCISLFDVDII